MGTEGADGLCQPWACRRQSPGMHNLTKAFSTCPTGSPGPHAGGRRQRSRRRAPVGRPAAGGAPAEPGPGDVLSGQRARAGRGAGTSCSPQHQRWGDLDHGLQRPWPAALCMLRSAACAWQLTAAWVAYRPPLQAARRLHSSGSRSSTRCCCRPHGRPWRRHGRLAMPQTPMRCAATSPQALWLTCQLPGMTGPAQPVVRQQPMLLDSWAITSRCKGCPPQGRCSRWRARCRRCCEAQACLMRAPQRLQRLACLLAGSLASRCLQRRRWRQHCCTEAGCEAWACHACYRCLFSNNAGAMQSEIPQSSVRKKGPALPMAALT